LGDVLPVGRLFSLGSFLKISGVAQTNGKGYVLIFTKMVWAKFWVIFFKNSSGYFAHD
jgi:hypothetical protein